MLEDQSSGSLGKKQTSRLTGAASKSKKIVSPLLFLGQWLSLCLGCVGKLEMG